MNPYELRKQLVVYASRLLLANFILYRDKTISLEKLIDTSHLTLNVFNIHLDAYITKV